MRRRTRLTILVVLLIAALLAAIVALRSQAPPEPARLLPGADAFVYLDLKWVRRIGRVGPIPTVPRDPDYEQFIRETGFQFEPEIQVLRRQIDRPRLHDLSIDGKLQTP